MKLVITTGHETRLITALIAAAALRGPLHIIAGSAWVPSYAVAHAVRRATVDVEQTLGRVRLARAFSCYQLLDLLESTRGDGTPILVLDFLQTFFDSDLPLPVRLRTLRSSCRQLRRLIHGQPLTVFARQVAAPDYQAFCEVLSAAADEILQPPVQERTVWQPELF